MKKINNYVSISLRVMVIMFWALLLNTGMSKNIAVVKAETVQSAINGLTWSYSIKDNNAVNVVLEEPYNVTGELVVPATLDGYPVTEIGCEAFMSCKAKSIIIPEGVTKLASSVFWDSKIESITLPDSVTEVGSDLFRDCKSLTEVKLPSGLNSISYRMFEECSNLTSIDLPEGLTSIGAESFIDCGLTSISIPESVTYIGWCAFEGTDISSVTLSKNIENLGSNVFAYCRNLEKITVSSQNKVYASANGILYSKDYKKLITCPPGMQGTCSIRKEVKVIGKDAFATAEKLTSVTLPVGVTEIQEGAFNCNSGIKSICIPRTVTKIGKYAFLICNNLKSVYYLGTKEQWNKIISKDNAADLKSVSKYFMASRITYQPKNKTYRKGTRASLLSVTAKKAVKSDGKQVGKVTYQWYKNSKNKTTGGAKLKYGTSKTFRPSTKKKGTNYYYCVIKTTYNGYTTTVTTRAAKITIK